MNNDFVVYVAAGVAAFLFTVAIPVYLVPRVLRYWDDLPGVVKSVFSLVKPFLFSIVWAVWLEIKGAVNFRVKKTASRYDDEQWRHAVLQIEAYLNRLR